VQMDVEGYDRLKHPLQTFSSLEPNDCKHRVLALLNGVQAD